MNVRAGNVIAPVLSILVLSLLLFSANPDSGFSTRENEEDHPVEPAAYYGVTGQVDPHRSTWHRFRIPTEALGKTTEGAEGRETSRERPFPPDGYRFWKKTDALLTAYDPSERSCGKFANGRTSTGENAWEMDGVAVDPDVIPYGTKIWIPGIGFRVADDTGQAMRDSWKNHGRIHIDIRMTYPYQARKWGIQNRPVFLFRPVEDDK